MPKLNTLVTYKDSYELMLKKVKGPKYYIAKVEYTQEDYDRIISQSKEYVVYTENEEIKYIVTEKSATPVTSNSETLVGEPKVSDIVVKDNEFAGILVYCQHESETYMIYSLDDEGEGLVLINGETAGLTEDSFSFNPGDRKLVNTYRIMKRSDWENRLWGVNEK
ncbi:MAG: hypothetical protein IKM61_07700 [Eubacteriaceae bacterium]|nr:hypothetical protein [Eubacteriaceae bacterium]